MRTTLILLAAAATTVALTLADSSKPAEAQVIYPWCANYGGRAGGAPNCGFVSYAQCMATLQGMGGYCGENPWYDPPPPRRARRAQ